MSAQVEIDAGSGADAYKITVTARSMDAFLEFARQPALKGREGEELVEMMLMMNHGKILRIERMKDGKFNDAGIAYRAREEYFGAEGGLSLVERYKDGKRNDQGEDFPAVVQLYDDYRPKKIMRFTDGVQTDSPGGKPAVEEFYETGVKQSQTRYRNDWIVDSASGEPAHIEFDRFGDIKRAVSYNAQSRTRELDKDEIAKLSLARDAEVAQKITKAVPAFKFPAKPPKP